MTQVAVQQAAVAVQLHGPGRVGRALLERLSGAGIAVEAVHGSRGLVARRAIEARRRVLVDATPPRYGSRGEAHVELLERTLAAGTSVVTCNKAPVAQAWARLERAARSGGATLAISATVGAGTPVLATLRRLLEAHGVARVEASLSGTLAFVAARVKAGASLADATRAAQEAGFAEPDPRLDLDGTDAAAKAAIVRHLLWPGGARPPAAPPLDLSEGAIRALGAPAVVAHASPDGVALRLQEWEPVVPGHAQVTAFLLDGQVVRLAGPGAGVEATAGALLADLHAVASGRTAPGIFP